MAQRISGGLVHELPNDLVDALIETSEITKIWESLTPIARNEFICWVEDAKQDKTRARRIRRTVEELAEGQRRPCCWAGCIHRTDKNPGKWQQAVLIDKKPRRKKPGAAAGDCLWPEAVGRLTHAIISACGPKSAPRHRGKYSA